MADLWEGSSLLGRCVPKLLLLVLFAAPPAHAGEVVINNGQTWPEPYVIDATNSLPDDSLSVQNLGCNVPVEPCPLPWENPTEAELFSIE